MVYWLGKLKFWLPVNYHYDDDTNFLYWDVFVILAGHWDIFMGVCRNLFSVSGLQITPWEQELLGKSHLSSFVVTVCSTHWFVCVGRQEIGAWRSAVLEPSRF